MSLIGVRTDDHQHVDVSSRLAYQDATATPVVSPATGTTLALTIPANAVALVVRCSAAFRHGDGDRDGTAGDGYAYAAADSDVFIPVVKWRGTVRTFSPHVAGSATWYFYFETLEGRI